MKALILCLVFLVACGSVGQRGDLITEIVDSRSLPTRNKIIYQAADNSGWVLQSLVNFPEQIELFSARHEIFDVNSNTGLVLHADAKDQKEFYEYNVYDVETKKNKNISYVAQQASLSPNGKFILTYNSLADDKLGVFRLFDVDGKEMKRWLLERGQRLSRIAWRQSSLSFIGEIETCQTSVCTTSLIEFYKNKAKSNLLVSDVNTKTDLIQNKWQAIAWTIYKPQTYLSDTSANICKEAVLKADRDILTTKQDEHTVDIMLYGKGKPRLLTKILRRKESDSGMKILPVFNLQFSPDCQFVFFQHGNEIYSLQLSNNNLVKVAEGSNFFLISSLPLNK